MGRPKIDKEHRNVVVAGAVPREVADWIYKLCHENGDTVAATVRRILVKEKERRENEVPI